MELINLVAFNTLFLKKLCYLFFALYVGVKNKCRDAQKMLDLCHSMIHNSLNLSICCLAVQRLSPPPSSFGVDLARFSRVALFFACAQKQRLT